MLSVAFALLISAPAAAGKSNARDQHRWALAAQDTATPALDLRVALGRLLGEHAFLLMEATRADVSSPDRVALVAAVDDNTTALRSSMAGVYGDKSASRFERRWQQHVDLLLAYSDAKRAGDRAAADAAQKRLLVVSAELGDLLAGLNPGIDAGAVAEAMHAHIDQVAAFSDGNYADGFAANRAAFGHMFALGDALALEIVRQRGDAFPDAAAAFSPRVDLRIALDQLLGEHVVLAALAMRAGVSKTPDFEAATASLDRNTEDLAAAIADIYGPEAAEQFGEMWSQHVSAYLEFVQALGAGDDARRAASLGTLHAYHEQISTLLAEVNPLLERGQVADLIRRHIQALITQAEATQAGDPARAIAATREGYEGTFEVGAAVAEAVAKQFPERYPERRRLPPTDAVPAELPFAKWLAVLAALVLGLGIQIALYARLRTLRAVAPRTR